MTQKLSLLFIDEDEYELRVSEKADGRIEFMAMIGSSFISADLTQAEVNSLVKSLCDWSMKIDMQRNKRKAKK